jgi:hypothetical protein
LQDEFAAMRLGLELEKLPLSEKVKEMVGTR